VFQFTGIKNGLLIMSHSFATMSSNRENCTHKAKQTNHLTHSPTAPFNQPELHTSSKLPAGEATLTCKMLATKGSYFIQLSALRLTMLAQRHCVAESDKKSS